MDVPVEPRQLRYFVAVPEELHFGRAPPSVCTGRSPRSPRSVGSSELGVALLVRATRRVELTPAGSVLLERGRRALGEIDAASSTSRRSSALPLAR